jgi:hypothetical protein
LFIQTKPIQKKGVPAFYRLLASVSLLALASCTHQPSATTSEPSREETLISCVAEIVEIKRAPWVFRLTHIDTTWQGPLSVSIRLLAPPNRSGERQTLGVYDERELVIGGVFLAPGDTITFRATESVLSHATIPFVFSNLREVARETPSVPAGPMVSR